MLTFSVWLENKERVVTFDFDSTLTRPQWDGYWVEGDPEKHPHDENIELLKKHIAQGDKVYIVTSRMANLRPEIEKFVKKHNLPVVDIILTDGNEKGPILAQLKSSIHYDDAEQSWEDPDGLFQGKWVKIPHPMD